MMATHQKGSSRPVNQCTSSNAHSHVQFQWWVFFCLWFLAFSALLCSLHFWKWLWSHICSQECFDSLLSILHWSWTTLVLGVEELRGLKGFQYTATLLDLERLRFVGTCCLRLLRVYICEIFPIAGQSKQNFNNLAEGAGVSLSLLNLWIRKKLFTGKF